MARWLLKTEPTVYCWDDLVREKRTVWDGIENALALIHLRAAAAGDEAFFYHTGKERRVVGIAKIARGAYPDPRKDDSKLVVVDIVPVSALPAPVTLERIKADPFFADWDLVRMSRLSFLPVPAPIWKKILTLSASG